MASADRLRGLAPRQAELLRRTMRLHAAGDHLMSGLVLLELSGMAPSHSEVQRWQGLRAQALGETRQAADHLSQAAALRPDDFQIRLEQAAAQDQALQFDAALANLGAAAACATSASEWLALSVECDRQGHYDAALAAVDRCLQVEPARPMALLQRIRCRKALGQTEGAAADCRRLIALDRQAAQAWFSLVDLKTVPLSDAERMQLTQAVSKPGLTADERLLLDFAVGKVLEDAGAFADALNAFGRANALAAAGESWNAQGFAQHVAAVRTAFEGATAAAQPQGSEVVFLVGLPRSGTTLVEQVLASHSQVEGASELPYLKQVIEEESWRRGSPFPAWVPAATTADWTRMGQSYLKKSTRWRMTKPISTDKLPENWLLAGAIRAMLPQARVIDCRRDAFETCWSCYKQRFAPGLASYSYAFGSLAGYWHAYDRQCREWVLHHPEHLRVQHYEALVSEPEAQIRALLNFCGLPFEPGCLSFHSAQRAIRTPSALQVRQPLRSTSTPAARYGELLKPLRDQLLGNADP